MATYRAKLPGWTLRDRRKPATHFTGESVQGPALSVGVQLHSVGVKGLILWCGGKITELGGSVGQEGGAGTQSSHSPGGPYPELSHWGPEFSIALARPMPFLYHTKSQCSRNRTCDAPSFLLLL